MAAFKHEFGLPIPNFERQHAMRTFEQQQAFEERDLDRDRATPAFTRKLTFKWSGLTRVLSFLYK